MENICAYGLCGFSQAAIPQSTGEECTFAHYNNNINIGKKKYNSAVRNIAF